MALSMFGLRPGRHGQALGLKDADRDGIGLPRGYAVAQSFEAWHPGARRGRIYPADLVGLTRLGPSGSVQPFGTPIIHSIKAGAGIDLQGGRFARPVNPQAQPIK